MTIDRRNALRAIATIAGSAAALRQSEAADESSEKNAFTKPPQATDDRRLQIVMLVHPDMTALDLVAPQLIFATMPNADVHLAWKDLLPISTDSRLKIIPTTLLEDAPTEPDVLFVPGGLKGTTAMMLDGQIIEFLRTRGRRSRWVTSVCTGGLLLGAAGLLQGYRATTHWYVKDLLSEFGAVPVDARVVQDKNRITGAGVTAGIDMALTVSAAIQGQEFARRQTLVFEYAPEPPFLGGTPARAPKALTESILQARKGAIRLASDAAKVARGKWPPG